MRMRALATALLAMLGLADAAAAQAPASAEEAARGFFSALDGGRWDEAAGLVLPAAARRHRELDLSMRLAHAALNAKGQRSGSFVVSSTGTVRADELRRYGSSPMRTLRGVSTLAEAAALPPEAYMARVMEAASNGPPGAIRMSPPAKHHLLGVVMENDSIAHAVYRVDGRRGMVDDAAAAENLLLRKQQGRWYVVPGQMMFSIASFEDFATPN